MERICISNSVPVTLTLLPWSCTLRTTAQDYVGDYVYERKINITLFMSLLFWYPYTDWFQIGKGVHQGCVLSPCLFNFYAEYIMRNVGLESRLLGEIPVTSDMQMTPPLWQKVKRNSKAS